MGTIGGTKEHYWMKVFLPILLLSIILIIVTTVSPLPEAQSQNQGSEPPVEIKFLEASELKDWIDRREVFLLVDARRPEEYARDHIPTGVSVPYPHLAVARMELEEAGWDDPVVFYCNSPPTCKAGPCATVIARMLQSGANQVYWFKGGMKAWRAVGYPVKGLSQERSRQGGSRA